MYNHSYTKNDRAMLTFREWVVKHKIEFLGLCHLHSSKCKITVKSIGVLPALSAANRHFPLLNHHIVHAHSDVRWWLKIIIMQCDRDFRIGRFLWSINRRFQKCSATVCTAIPASFTTAEVDHHWAAPRSLRFFSGDRRRVIIIFEYLLP